MADAERLALQLADAARDAWDDVRQQKDPYRVVGMGADGTETSHADRVLDDAILALARDLGVSVISEESGRTGDEGPWAYVDPLDGSRNAARGIPFYCTSIAIADTPSAASIKGAVVRNLVSGETIHAGLGPVHIDGQVATLPPWTPDEVMVAVIADSAEDEIKAEQGRRGHHLRDFGSAALELAYVSVGRLDAFLVRRPWLRNIDIAAGIHLVHQAGGICQSPEGTAIELGLDVTQGIGIVATRTAGVLEAVQ